MATGYAGFDNELYGQDDDGVRRREECDRGHRQGAGKKEQGGWSPYFNKPALLGETISRANLLIVTRLN